MLWRYESQSGRESTFFPSVTPGGHKNIALFLMVNLQTIAETNRAPLEEKAALSAVIAT